MRRFLTIICLVTGLFLVAQEPVKIFPLSEQQHELEITVELDIDALNSSGLVIRPLNNTVSQDISSHNLVLIGPDLELELRLLKPMRMTSYRIQAQLYNEDGQLVGRPNTSSVFTRKTASLSWEDVTESGFYPGASYRAIISTTLVGPVDCTSPPRFKLRSWDWLALAGVGAGTFGIGLGQVYRQQNTDDYNAYLANWKNGDISPVNRTLFNNASQAYQNTKTATFIGAGLLLISSSALLLKWRRHLAKKKIYREYCSNSSLSFQLAPAKDGSLGLSLIGQFQ